ncbi:A/G-specific adenine glycosylase [Pinibacter soli]|uniref:Adenine DNA glycosylase n=1 Tax=Pinibacter soli TaxID=3044211 RepID=A0ABT6R8M2_9BACT|nr:A/G-specific adenine glycosylase [Pinibacter soli]MDI3318907.1 A/G-specific adenine glycosylase [Pinibacter soli]
MNFDFTRKLMEWNSAENNRSMPWKGEKDPYKIWLSEIILQQTRVEQGLAYYNKFVETFPTVKKLAKAPEEKVFKLWEGLGYYSRCKNLIATAKIIDGDYKGRFPSTYEHILALKGIGPYTAAAIASFAFNLPHAVVDGNVLRVLSRYFGMSTPVDSTHGKKLYNQLADSLLDKESPGIYNQAIMDFGAVVCKPQNPLCSICPQKSDCRAFQHAWVNDLPVKEKVLKKKTRYMYYFVISVDGKTFVKKREAKDIWQNLYEFVLHEHDEPIDWTKKNIKEAIKSFIDTPFQLQGISTIVKQQLTHQLIIGQLIKITVQTSIDIPGYELLTEKDIKKLAFPKFINTLMQQEVTLF